MFGLTLIKNIYIYHIFNPLPFLNVFVFQNKIATVQKITWIDFIYSAPEIFLSIVILVQLCLVGTAHFFPKTNPSQGKELALSLYTLAKNTLLICLIICLYNIIFFSKTHIAFNGYIIVDIYTQVLKIFVLGTTWSILVASARYFLRHPRHLMEYPALILLNTVFLFIFISSYNLITTFLTLVGFSLNIYVLLLNDSFNHSSREAGIKYYYLSTFSSGLILGGVLLLYLFLHTTNFLAITWILHDTAQFGSFWMKNMLLYIALYFIIFGFFFKLASFPCHFWAPEVYDGSPHPVTAFLVLPVKIATFGLLLRILNYVFLDVYYIWEYVIWMSSFFSMIWGCLGALNEPLVKRFIAYSSINQMGFLFLGLVCGNFEGTRASLIYLLLYTIMNLGFFILFLNTVERKKQRSLTYLSDFNHYAQDNYFYTVTFVVILFSMAGIPPLGGFFGKYYLFLHAFEAGHIDLVITGMVTSLIAAYYYLRIIKIMWFEQPAKRRFFFKTTFTEFLFGYYVAIEFVLIFFVIWSPILFKYANWLTATCMNPLNYTIFSSMNNLEKIKNYIATVLNSSHYLKTFVLVLAHVLGFILLVEITLLLFGYLGFSGEAVSKSFLFLWKSLGFFVLPTIIIFLSGLVVLNTNPIYSLASLILVFFSAAVFLLSIKITFLAMIYLIIYIGAIAILFLFVIMMFNLRNLKQGPGVAHAVFSYNFVFYCFIVWEFYATFCSCLRYFSEYNQYFFWQKENSFSDLTYYLIYQHVDVLLFGTLLYTYYSYLFILSALILLTAMLGAIVLALSTSERTK